jgi:hypothetical protein
VRLVKLSVQRFQCIESAELELGPHLNVLYGPNDLGKSSLAWAIRAVLLLQHGSSHAARFSSWYDDAEPRVALTICDDDGRYWRVTKVFGGSSGRSTLESSKDGKTFVAESSAREVDKRLREILRWGLAAPGGQGRTAMPDSFLTQVLLADQSEGGVRDILFASKLEDDPDESGRQRLIEALGALAQDPLFKQVLDQTAGYVGQAFSSTGRRRRGAGSPWVEMGERIAALKKEQDELEARVRDSAAVETRIRQLHDERDRLHAQAADAEEILEVAQRHLAVKRQRDALTAELATHEQRLQEVDTLAAAITTDAAQVELLSSEVARLQTAVERGQAEVASGDAAVDQLRVALDALIHDDPDADHAAALEAAVTAAGDRVREAVAAATTASETVRAAAQAAAQLSRDEADARNAAAAVETTAVAAAEASGELERAQRAVEDAREKQRNARSNDRTQARELRRQELENRRLALRARKIHLEGDLGRAQDVGRQLSLVAEAESTLSTLARGLRTSREAAGVDDAALTKLGAGRQELARLEAYGRYRELRTQLASATDASEQADRARARGAELRERAELLRAELRPGLPDAARLAALRKLREGVRIAEAALGGGISVVVRPRRPVEIRAIRDGVVDPAAAATEPVTLTAGRVLTLGIGDVADLEITAGEDAARRAAEELRGRWLREGEAILVEHRVASLEELDAVRTRADAVAREIDECLREAVLLGERPAPTIDTATLREQLTAADAELVGVDREDLATRLARLGDPWQAGLQRKAKELEADLETRRGALEIKRAAVARLEAQVESQQAEVARLQAEVAAAQSQLAEPWSVVVATTTQQLQQLLAEQAELEQQLQHIASGASADEADADAAVEAAQARLEAAVQRARSTQAEAQTALVTQAGHQARLEASRVAAQELDVAEAERARLAADTALSEARVAHSEATAALAALRAAREAAVQDLRKRVVDAETTARAARKRAEEAHAAHQRVSAEHSAAVVRLAEMRVRVASVNLDETRARMAELRAHIDRLEPIGHDGRVDDNEILRIQELVKVRRGAVRDVDEELARARGALEQVGGAIVRERLDEIGKALARALEREHEIEVEYEAWKLLQETLRESESTETAHLGRTLAGPVSDHFRRLTRGRYGELELGAHLEAGGIHVSGELREIGALSAGTQDQLATLLRVCIAQQLRSVIVLDDHLSQSDTERVAWFNKMLREACAGVQIVLITCRPGEVLASTELPTSAEARRTSGSVDAIDLSKVIRRFTAGAR